MASSTIVLFGGPSEERRVSVASAQHVAASLADSRLWFWSPSGHVYQVGHAELRDHAEPFIRSFEPTAAPAFPSIARALDAADGAKFLLALHGIGGEDGTLQAQLEARGLRYTGSDSNASARAFDKVEAKRLLKAAGARVPDGVAFDALTEAQAAAEMTTLLARSPRWVMKPRKDGSSHGMVMLSSSADAAAAARTVGELACAYLAEEFISGRELSVAVIERGTGLRALPPTEVVLSDAHSFDYEGKYLGRGTTEVTPAAISSAQRDAAHALALLAHRVLGCRGYSRTDLILAPGNNVCFLEINTLPGLTQASFLPQQLEAAHIDFSQFLQEQLASASAAR